MKTKLKAIIDTNIFLAGLLNEFGAPAKLIKFFQNDAFVLILSEDIFQEYREVILEFDNTIILSMVLVLILLLLRIDAITSSDGINKSQYEILHFPTSQSPSLVQNDINSAND